MGETASGGSIDRLARADAERDRIIAQVVGWMRYAVDREPKSQMGVPTLAVTMWADALAALVPSRTREEG